MPVNVLFAAGAELWPAYAEPLRRALSEAGVVARVDADGIGPGDADYVVIAPGGPVSDFRPFTRAKALLNLWAGVEKLVGNRTITQPLLRMVNSELTEGMVEYVVGHVLRHHLGMDRHILGQDGLWRNGVQTPYARTRTVAMLGLGVLGAASARMLRELNFRVVGWSASAKRLEGIESHTGEDGLRRVLGQADFVVLLLPLTGETRDILNARSLGWLKPGAVIVNPGRGALIDDDALLAALDAGRVGYATLDVFRIEPLPPEHRYWTHPKVTVTPHIAADTRADSAARVLAENIRRGEAGEPFLFQVDRSRGY
jgi:glyoxylate/hydroxypyruvate reductase A